MSHVVWECPIAKQSHDELPTNMLEMKWDMWVMEETLTNLMGLWWVPWFPYKGPMMSKESSFVCVEGILSQHTFVPLCSGWHKLSLSPC